MVHAFPAVRAGKMKLVPIGTVPTAGRDLYPVIRKLSMAQDLRGG